MSTMRILAAAAFATVFAGSTASAQTQRVSGTIDKAELRIDCSQQPGALALRLPAQLRNPGASWPVRATYSV
jgi:hypothetical protein